MDENHNEVGALNPSKQPSVPTDVSWLHAAASSSSHPYPKPNSTWMVSNRFQPGLGSSYEKLKKLNHELATTYDRLKFNFETEGPTSGGGDADSGNEEAKLLLQINSMFGPEQEVRGGRMKETVAIFDSKEKEKLASQMSLVSTMFKYKDMYFSTLNEFQTFKNTVQKSISNCQTELGVTVDSLKEAHRQAIHSLQIEKRELETEFQNTKREIVQLECKNRCLEDELSRFKEQYNQKCKEVEEGYLDKSLINSQRAGLTQAHEVLFEQMTAAQQRNEIYKSQLAEISHNNASLLNTISKMSDDHAKELCELKEQLDSNLKDHQQQQDTFRETISELTAALQSQVEYTEVVLEYTKKRELEHQEAKTLFESYIGKTIKKCTKTVTCLENKLRAEDNEKVLLKREIENLVSKLKNQDEGIKNIDSICHKCQVLPAAADVSPERHQEMQRFAARISELEELNVTNNGRIQRIQLKYRHLFEKYLKCKEASVKKSEELKSLLRHSRSVEKELQPLFNDQIYQLEKQLSDAQLKHAQFQAILQGIQSKPLQAQPTESLEDKNGQ